MNVGGLPISQGDALDVQAVRATGGYRTIKRMLIDVQAMAFDVLRTGTATSHDLLRVSGGVYYTEKVLKVLELIERMSVEQMEEEFPDEDGTDEDDLFEEEINFG